MKRQIRVKVRGKWHTVEVEEPQRYPFQVTVDGEVIEVEVEVGQQQWDPASTSSKPPPEESTGPVGLTAITQEDQKIIPLAHARAHCICLGERLGPGDPRNRDYVFWRP